MRGELVALDLETTGLDSATDAIIEIGIVRMKEGAVTAEYSTLVNPGRPIPANIVHLTGIQPEEVVGAPGINQVLVAVSTFVGSAPVIAHNAAFDLGFLRPHGILQNNLRLDTYELASVLLPRAAGYGLASLSVQHGITHEHKHRALDDARAAALLYWALWNKALELPYAALYEICMAAQGLDWDARPVFEAALEERRNERSTLPPDGDLYRFDSLTTPAEAYQTLRPNPAAAVNPETITALMDEAGTLARQMPGYEKRPQQIQMALAVAEALTHSRHVMIEAGTGTGKSLAYLLPAMLWAAQNGDRVVISTNTINLQEQLITRDIPSLNAALDLPVKTAVLKGRANYLCPRRLAALRRRQPNNVDELRTLAKILVWLLEGGTGDRGEISLRGPVENSIWQRLSAEDEGCSLERCRATMEGACPFYKARKAAESAHVLVINHALLLSDAVSGQAIMPDYRCLILDEAHNLEDAATNSIQFRLDETALRRRLSDLGSASQGLLGDLLFNVRSHIPDKQLARLEAFVQNIGAAVGAMEAHITALFNAFRRVLQHTNSSRAGDYHVQLRITPQLRASPNFEACRAAWLPLREFFDVIGEAMRRLTDGLSRLESYPIPHYADLVSSTGAVARHLAEIQNQLNAFTLEPDDNTIYWLSSGQNGNYTAVNCAPLNVGALLKERVWSQKNAVVLTSATLRTDSSFDYLRQRLGTEHAGTLELGTPFDYRTSALVFLPGDIPEPNDPGYQPAFERALIELATALGGRTMVLFTSYTHLQQTKQAISARLELLGGITVYDQTEGGSRQALLEGFRTTERAVLMGTKSFWEGVDVPGEALSALVIARLPFAVPTEPIFAARSETYADGFKSYAVPDAVLRFRQGFGRLIRSTTDRGIVAILDRRIISKNYGTSFLESLPDCTIQYGELRTLAETAQNWLREQSHAV